LPDYFVMLYYSPQQFVINAYTKNINHYSHILQQMGIAEDSDESMTAADIKEDNKQLQQKVQKNEKLLQQLQQEQSAHEQLLKVNILLT